MTAKKTIQIDADLYQELQDIAEPLVDDINSVLNKLLNAWKKQKKLDHAEGVAYWISARGERLLVGLRLRATYKGNEFWATVQKNGIEFDGKLYPSPSKAAIAAKRHAGAKGSAANQNGWRFWLYFEHSDEEWHPIEVMRNTKNAR